MQFDDIPSNWVIFPLHGTDGGCCTCGKRSCSSPGKHPAPGVCDFLTVASPRDEARTKWPSHKGNWAVIPGQSGFIGIDVDVKDGKQGRESFLRVQKNYGILPDTMVVNTPSGGFHALFLRPDVPTIPNSNGTIANGIDIRCDHGYLLTPGSAIFGRRYSIFKDYPMAPLPEGWRQLLLEQECGKKKQSQLSGVVPKLPNVADYPSQSEADFALAGEMKGLGCDFDQFCVEVVRFRGHDKKSKDCQYLRRTWDNVSVPNQDDGEIDLVGVEYVAPGEYLWRCTGWRKIAPYGKPAFRFDGEIVGGCYGGAVLSLFCAAPAGATGATKLAAQWRIAGDGTTRFKADYFVGKAYRVAVADVSGGERSKVDRIISSAVHSAEPDDAAFLTGEMRQDCNNRNISPHSSPTLHSTQRMPVDG